VSHGKLLPIPEPPESFSVDSDEDENTDDVQAELDIHEEVQQPSTSRDPPFCTSLYPSEPHKITESELNDLIRDLELPMNKAELLASRLQQWNLLDHFVKVTTFRTPNNDYDKLYQTEGELTVCNDIAGVIAAMNMRHVPEEIELFIDASKVSLKAVLLCNGNMLPSIPIAYIVHKQETYVKMENILLCVHYLKYEWHICDDLKVIAILLGLQKGYTKYCCFLCEWGNRAKVMHYKKRSWPERKSLTPGMKNV
ncbi:hypothetical protein L798_00777, partial [Zootermopsis nevadensis]